MMSREKNPVLLVLAAAVVFGLTVLGKAKLHGFGPEADGGSQALSMIIGLVVIAAFCGALYYIKKP